MQDAYIVEIERGLVATIKSLIEATRHYQKPYSVFELICDLIDMDNSFNDDEWLIILECLAGHDFTKETNRNSNCWLKNNFVATIIEYLKKHADRQTVQMLRLALEQVERNIKSEEDVQIITQATPEEDWGASTSSSDQCEIEDITIEISKPKKAKTSNLELLQQTIPTNNNHSLTPQSNSLTRLGWVPNPSYGHVYQSQINTLNPIIRF